GEGDAGVGDADQHFLFGGEVAGNEDGGGGAGFGAMKISFIFRKGEVAGMRAVGGGEAGEDHGSVTSDFTLELSGNFCGSKGHNLIYAVVCVKPIDTGCEELRCIRNFWHC